MDTFVILYRYSIQEDNKPTLSQASGVDDSKKFFYEIPYWMHLSFISYDKIGRTVETSVEKTAEGESITLFIIIISQRCSKPY